MTLKKTSILKPLLSGVAMLPLVIACNHSENSDTSSGDSNSPKSLQSANAVIATVATDFTSGAMSVVTVAEPRTTQNDLNATGSDIRVVADGTDVFLLERSSADNITKFSAADLSTAVWQYSVLDEGEAGFSNPSDLIVASDTKAYLLRYGKAKGWVVDPTAASAAEFKIGEFDLGSYDSTDGIPEMEQGVVINGKLFVILQAMDTVDINNWMPGQAYVAVIDVNTDAEIDTGQSDDPAIKGIPLPVKNPEEIVYDADSNKLYIVGSGWSWGASDKYSGGIVSVDPDSYAVETIVDDGDDQVHPYGNMVGVAIVSPQKAYFVGSANWGDDALFGFNPSTGEVDAVSPANIFGKHLSDIAVDPAGKLWVGSRTDFGVIVVDPDTDVAEDQIISTGALVPDTIVFAQ